jgi:hypothetical protein
MTCPFAALISPPRVPVWHGATRVRSLWDTHRSGSYGKRWVPWTLLVPGVTFPTRGVVARCWAVLQ